MIKGYQLDSSYFEEIKSEVVGLLSRYIKIDTSHPPGDTGQAIEFLKELFEKEGISYKVYEYSREKKSIIAWLKNDDSKEKPLLLLNHMDVVAADKSKWAFDPLSGDVEDGYIRGRGALDMKGMAIAQLMSLIIAKRKGIRLKRGLMVLFVADEEIGGFHGAKYIVDNFFNEIDPEVVLDEGGFGYDLLGKKQLFLVSCSQKKSLWLRIRAKGTSGHGSQPIKENPNNILLAALDKLSGYQWPIEKDSRLRLLFRYLVGKDKAGFEFLNTLVSNTLAITTLYSGDTINVIPSTAEATLDCRLFPHTDVESVLSQLNKVINDHRIEIEVVKRTDEVVISDFESCFLRNIQNVLNSNFNNAKLIPFITPVGTDSKYFRQKGVQSYGLFPIFLNLDDLRTIHGVNEKISIDNLLLGTKLVHEICINYCM